MPKSRTWRRAIRSIHRREPLDLSEALSPQPQPQHPDLWQENLREDIGPASAVCVGWLRIQPQRRRRWWMLGGARRLATRWTNAAGRSSSRLACLRGWAPAITGTRWALTTRFTEG